MSARTKRAKTYVDIIIDGTYCTKFLDERCTLCPTYRVLIQPNKQFIIELQNPYNHFCLAEIWIDGVDQKADVELRKNDKRQVVNSMLNNKPHQLFFQPTIYDPEIDEETSDNHFKQKTKSFIEVKYYRKQSLKRKLTNRTRNSISKVDDVDQFAKKLRLSLGSDDKLFTCGFVPKPVESQHKVDEPSEEQDFSLISTTRLYYHDHIAMKAVLDKLEESRKKNRSKRPTLFDGEWQMQQEFKLKPTMKNTSEKNVINVDEEDKTVISIDEEDEVVEISNISAGNMSIEISDDEDDAQEIVDLDDNEMEESTHASTTEGSIVSPIKPPALIQQPSAIQVTSAPTGKAWEDIDEVSDSDEEQEEHILTKQVEEDHSVIYLADEPVYAIDMNEEYNGF